MVAAGVVVSVRDYKAWRYEETKNYGHGPLESLAEPRELAQRYANEYAGFRMRYPAGWQAEEILKNRTDLTALGEVYEPKELTGAVLLEDGRGEVEIRVSVDQARGDLVTVLEEQVRAAEGEGIKLVREREYLNTDREDWGVITWEVGERTVRLAVAVAGGREVVVLASCTTKNLGQYIRTLDEIIKSINIL